MEGVREGFYFDAKPRLPRFNIHIPFVIQRLAVIGILTLATAKYPLVAALGCGLVLPFFHDGAYYLTRHLLDKSQYPRGFWDNPSKTSTAVLDFKLSARIVLLLIGTFFIFVVAVSN